MGGRRRAARVDPGLPVSWGGVTVRNEVEEREEGVNFLPFGKRGGEKRRRRLLVTEKNVSKFRLFSSSLSLFQCDVSTAAR